MHQRFHAPKWIIATAAAFMAWNAIAAEKAGGVRNVVLVHGAWADGSSWSKVIPQLEKAGLHVTAVQSPLTSLANDVATTKRAIALQDGPVILVGHSYGGAVISDAGVDPKVVGLVYVAAFAPADGEAIADLGKEFPPAPGGAEIRPDSAGFLRLTSKGFLESFAQDVPMAERVVLAATQGPINGAALGEKLSNAAWKTKPSWYIVATNDRMIPPDLERKFAKSMNAMKTVALPTSHVPMISRPADVAKVIIEAARRAQVN